MTGSPRFHGLQSGHTLARWLKMKPSNDKNGDDA